MSENYIVINGKRAELTKEQMEQLGIEVKGNKRWRANLKEKFWFIADSNEVDNKLDYYTVYDDFRYYSHNYFRTKEKAETYARVLKTEMLLKKYADEHNQRFHYEQYFIVYDGSRDGRCGIDSCDTMCEEPRTIWFSSKEIAKNAIDEIGEGRIKEYLTYEW